MKAASEIYSPLAGTVVEKVQNSKLNFKLDSKLFCKCTDGVQCKNLFLRTFYRWLILIYRRCRTICNRLMDQFFLGEQKINQVTHICSLTSHHWVYDVISWSMTLLLGVWRQYLECDIITWSMTSLHDVITWSMPSFFGVWRH